MKFTDIFIRRPVLATVVSLVILVVGLRSFSSLQVLEYPHTENGVVTISTSFPGRRPGGHCRLRHDADRGRGRAGERHRLHDIEQPEQHQHDHGVPAAELRHLEGRGRNQHQGEFDSEPAALRHAAADHHRESRTDHRCDVHRFHQSVARLERDHGLPDPRGATAPAGRRGRADRRDLGRPDLFAARLARSQEARGLWDDGERCGGGLGEQRLRLRDRHHQGSDDPGHPDLDHEPAFPGRVPHARRQIGERRECALERCRAGDARRGQLRGDRRGRWPYRRLRRHPGGSGRQLAGRHQGRARHLSRYPRAAAARSRSAHHVRLDRLRECVHS